MAKSTDAEILIRVNTIQNDILSGQQNHQIFRYASVWSVTERTIEEYIARAKANILEINKADFQEKLALVSTNWWTLYNNGDEKTKATALTNLAKIWSLDQVNVNHFLKDERLLTDKTDAELDELLGGKDAENGQ